MRFSGFSGFARFAGSLVALIIVTSAVPEAAVTRPVSVRTDDGVTLTGMLYESPRRPAPAVILLHMLTRTRDDWQTFANRLADAGIHALALDFRGHGASSGSLVNAAGEPDLSRLVLDVQAARAFLTARTELVRASAIGVAGASIGANIAILEAANDPVIRSLALLSAGLDYRSLRTTAAMQRYGARPAFLIAGSNDPYAQRSLRDLGVLGGGLRETRTLDTAGHGTVMLTRDSDLGRALVDWFQRTLL